MPGQIHCIDFLKLAKDMADSSADAIIADPPYSIGKDFGNDSDRMPIDEYISWCGEWVSECMRILKPSGTMFIYGFDERLARISALLPVERQRWLIWHYTNKNVASLHFWQRSHESIICAWKGKPLFNRDAIRVPYTDTFLKNCAGKARKATKSRYAPNGGVETIYAAHEGGALPRDVISIPTLAGGASLRERLIWCKTCGRMVNPARRKECDGHDVIMHPTQKPRALTETLLRSCVPEGGFAALIPFGGSGSECVAVHGMGGEFTACEINPEYVLLANEAVRNAG